MPKKREDEEIVVPASAFRCEKGKLLEDTTGGEAYDVFKASEKIGRGLSGLMIVVGFVLSILAGYGILTSVGFSFSDPLFVGALGFFGVINIFCGLLLLAKE